MPNKKAGKKHNKKKTSCVSLNLLNSLHCSGFLTGEMNRKVVYETASRDPQTELPIVVVDTTALPNPEDLASIFNDVPQYVDMLPKKIDFVVLFLASKAPRKPNIAFLHKLHASLDRDLKKRVKRVYVVHAKWYTRALNRALTPIISPKFAKKMEHAKNLSELAKILDITSIDFSPAVFFDDFEFTEKGDLGLVRVPKHCRPVFGERLPLRQCDYWQAALAYLSKAPLDDETFTPISRASQEQKDSVSVLLGAVKREQRLRLADYGPFVVLAVLKQYMATLPTPIVDLRTVPLPISSSQEYIDRCISRLSHAALLHLQDLITWLKTVKSVRLDLVAKSLGPSLIGSERVNREDFTVATEFLAVLIEHWDSEPKSANQEFVKQQRSVSMEYAKPVPPAPRRVHTDNTSHQQSTPPQTPPTPQTPQTPQLPSEKVRSEPSAIPSVLQEITESSTINRSPPKHETLTIVKSSNKPANESQFKSTSAAHRPRDLPSEVPAPPRPEPRIPHKKAFGRIAEIIKVYDETQWA